MKWAQFNWQVKGLYTYSLKLTSTREGWCEIIVSFACTNLAYRQSMCTFYPNFICSCFSSTEWCECCQLHFRSWNLVASAKLAYHHFEGLTRVKDDWLWVPGENPKWLTCRRLGNYRQSDSSLLFPQPQSLANLPSYTRFYNTVEWKQPRAYSLTISVDIGGFLKYSLWVYDHLKRPGT